MCNIIVIIYFYIYTSTTQTADRQSSAAAIVHPGREVETAAENLAAERRHQRQRPFHNGDLDTQVTPQFAVDRMSIVFAVAENIFSYSDIIHITCISYNQFM